MNPEITSASKGRVFISYKRNIDPDQAIAGRLLTDLQRLGYDVFIDRNMFVGQNWAEEIERQLKDCDYFIPLLTAASIASEMVQAEIDLARKHEAKILPVRLNYMEPLPYALQAYLAPIQYALWTGDGDTDALIQELSQAMSGEELLSTPVVGVAPTISGPPAYSAPLPTPGGALDTRDAWYIERSSDEHALTPISQPVETVVIKGPRQMGKTSLLVRTLEAAQKSGKRSAIVDFQMLGSESLKTPEAFFYAFVATVAEELSLDEDIEKHWKPTRTLSQNLTRYIKSEVLEVLNAPVVLAIDEAELLFEAPFMSDFFSVLRAWHNSRAYLGKEIWKLLSLIIATSTEPYLFIKNPNVSPFNVGSVVTLCDFNREEFKKVHDAHDCNLSTQEIEHLYVLLNGQPYLTRKAFYMLKAGTHPDRLFQEALDDRGPFGDHLRNALLRIVAYPELLAAMRRIAVGGGCADRDLARKLAAAGLVRTEDDKVLCRCELYAEYFRKSL